MDGAAQFCQAIDRDWSTRFSHDTGAGWRESKFAETAQSSCGIILHWRRHWRLQVAVSRCLGHFGKTCMADARLR